MSQERFEHTILHSPGPVAGFPGASHGPGPVVLDWQERTICTQQEWEDMRVKKPLARQVKTSKDVL